MPSQLNPSPRNFQHYGFWRHWTEGEIFWVIKQGSSGTSMVGMEQGGLRGGMGDMSGR
ncbi:MAG: hypothetical protein AAB177_05350 [Nitrospirota bacterium]